MVTRITAGAILVCGSKVLLLKRGLHKKLAPGLWAGIGGHMELTDIENPRALSIIETCYREVYEEAGIEKSNIKNLKLRYIAVRKIDGEIRWHHHYIGELESEIVLPDCDEGELHWIDKIDIPNLPMTTSVKEALKHWLLYPKSDDVFMVAVSKDNNSATIIEL